MECVWYWGNLHAAPAAHPSGTNLAGPHSMKGVKGSCSPKCTNVYWTFPYRPPYLTNKFKLNSTLYTGTRGSGNIHLGRPKSEHHRRSFEYSGALHYNRLPLTFKIMPRHEVFQKPPWKLNKHPKNTSFVGFCCCCNCGVYVIYIGPAWKPAMVDAAFPIQIQSIYMFTTVIEVQCSLDSRPHWLFWSAV